VTKPHRKEESPMTKLMCAVVVYDIAHGLRRSTWSVDPRHLARILEQDLAVVDGNELKVTEKGRVYATVQSIVGTGLRSEVVL